MCCFFQLEKMDSFPLFHHILDQMEKSEVTVLVKDATMHIGFMSGM